MNLRSIDLNLLVILDALLDEAHVSRAAERVGLSQPAASNALERCRAIFGDRLLERHGARMRRTPAAVALAPRLKAALAEVGAVLVRQESDPARLDATIRIATADQPAASLLPDLYADLSKTAPGVRLVVQTWAGGDIPLARLRQGECDLAFSVLPSTDGDIVSRYLGRGDYVIVMRAGHPASTAFDTESWLAWPHLLVSSDGSLATPLDGTLARLGLRRSVGMVVPSFMLVPDILRRTDLIAALPSTCIPDSAADLAVFDPPLAIEGFPLHLAWHRRQTDNPAVQLVVRLITRILGAA